MDNYIVSARKYRPTTFKSVVGQKSLTTTLKNAIAGNKLAHAYLFCGPRGVGKTTCARIFAKTINCLTPTADGEACNVCESCVSFNEQRSYNIHELDAASNNSVDDIRSLIDQVRIPPQIGKYKVYIIDEVHMLSSAAFNAFLKTLEEPPQHAIFILATTEKHKILPTILSRCQIYDFSRISISDTVEHLQYVAKQEGVTAEPEALNVLAQKADGGMRDALSIFDQVVSFTGGNVTYKAVIENLNVLDYEYYFKLTQAILEHKVTDGLLILNDILNKGFDGHNVITGIASHFRDLLLCKDSKTVELFEVGATIRDRYLEMSKQCDVKFLYAAIDLINDTDLNYRLSRNKRLLSDLMIIKLCQLGSDDGSDSEKKKSEIKPIFSKQESTSTPQPTTAPKEPQQEVRPVSEPLVIKENQQPQTVKKSVSAKSFSGLGVSISSVLNPQKKEEAKTAVSSQQMNETFTHRQLINAWIAYAESEDLKEAVLLRNAMNSCHPMLMEDNTTFQVMLINQGQEQLFIDNGANILTYLRNELKNSFVRMELKFIENNSEEEKEKKARFGSPHEKLKMMIEQNPSVQKLKDEFGLELT